MRARFAPTPTGDLHLGGALCALASWARAKSTGDAFIVRVEDLDPPRTVAGSAERIQQDLDWLGLQEDEGPTRGGPYAPYVQSARSSIYRDAVAKLERLGLVYPCTCSRAEIARASTAPHLGEEGPRYPGTCREPSHRKPNRPFALRLAVPEDARSRIGFDDRWAGHVEQDVAEAVGDFVLQRADGAYAYQLAVIVDDVAMRVDEVIRGDDLLGSTPRQILIAELLGARPPRYAHLPVVRGPDGERLAKRHQGQVRGTTVRELREQGVSAIEMLTVLGAALGVRPSRLDRSASQSALLAAIAAGIDDGAPHALAVPTTWLRPVDST